MQPSPPTKVTAWLRASRGDETQERLAQDIERVTGWHITRDRYSKYESGRLPIGPTVLGHFIEYWKGRGVPGPDEYNPVAGSGEDATKLDPAALLTRLDDYVTLVNKLVEQNAALMAALTNRQPELPPDLVPTMLRWAAAHMPPEPTEPRLPTGNHPDEPGQ